MVMSRAARDARWSASEGGAAARRRYRRTPKAILKARADVRIWRSRNPEKHNAHNRLGYAVEAGRIERLPCEMCGSTVHVEAHHPFGYLGDLALAVWWLCNSHHNGMHKFVRGALTS